MLRAFDGKTNFVLITLDSCRWDTFVAASTPNIHNLGRALRGYAQATFTLPAHVAMFAGKFPHVTDRVPYYNRFVASLIRIPPGAHPTNSYLEFPQGTPGVFEGFAAFGYHTLGLGAVGWFRHQLLQAPFQEFVLSGVGLGAQIARIDATLESTHKPLALLLNVGETHEPYEHIESPAVELASRTRMYAAQDVGFRKADLEKQVACCEFVDTKLGALFDRIHGTIGNTLVVVCADHGECFGEDGLYGHGFYHPKVMEVPILIAEI